MEKWIATSDQWSLATCKSLLTCPWLDILLLPEMTHEKRLNAHITKVVLSSKSEVVCLGILDLIHWISCFRHSHLYLSKDHIVITLRRSQADVRSVLFKLREVCMCSYFRLARYFRKMVLTCFEEAYSSRTWSPLRVIHVWWRNSISGPCSARLLRQVGYLLLASR